MPSAPRTCWRACRTSSISTSRKASKIDATLEHLRIGAIKGQILDADGSAVIYDLFTEFGVTAYAEVDFDLDNASPAPGAVKKKCHDIRRKIEDELGVVPYDHIHAMCGPDFFDDRSPIPRSRRHMSAGWMAPSCARARDEITGRDVTILLADFATVWAELFPTEQARIVQLLVERVDVQEDALEVRIRAEGLARAYSYCVESEPVIRQ